MSTEQNGLGRRSFITQVGAGVGVIAAGMALGAGSAGAATPSRNSQATTNERFWPGGIRLVISISMQFEAGGQPLKGTDSPFPRVDFPDSVPADAAANSWFAYGYREGIPRMLDLWDRHGIKVTSHMIGEAVRHSPDLAREIVRRGHEAAAHGPRWSSQYAMSRDEERAFLIAARDMVEEVTGQRPQG